METGDLFKIALSASIGCSVACILWGYLVNDKDIKTDREVISSKQDKDKLHVFRYIDEFLALRCVTDLIEHKLYPNAKEITESISILNVLRKFFDSSSKDKVLHNDYHFSNPKVTAVIIGDGSTPRIAALLCYVSKWEKVYCVDPQLKIHKNKSWTNIRNLQCMKSKIEDITINVEDDHNVLLVFMHSHVLLEASMESISGLRGDWKGKVSIITAPCCQFIEKHKMIYNTRPDHVFTDICMATNKNTFYVYKNMNGRIKK